MALKLGFSNPLHICLFVILTVFVFLQFIAPFSLPANTLSDLSGMAALNDHDELFEQIGLPWSLVYSLGDRMCHQKVERSLVFNGNQMPFCSRCTAIWLGAALGLLFLFFYKVELNRRFLLIIFISLIPIGVDGFGQLLGFWESTNLIRLLTGLLAGFICGISLGLIGNEFYCVLLVKVKNFGKKNNVN